MEHFQPYEIPQSLWSVIELYAPTVELTEIKYIIGDDVIEQSCELLEEIYNLLDIWRCVVATQNRSVPTKKSAFPEPPLIRDQFVQRIRSFMDNLDAAKNHMLKPFLEERKVICAYAAGSQTSSRPTSRGSDGRITPSRRPSSRNSSDLSPYRDNMSAFEIEKIVSDIQDAFIIEQNTLRDDIEFLQRSIDEEHHSKGSDDTAASSPSLYELKSFAEELENKVFDLSKPVFAEAKPPSANLKSLPTPPSKLPPSLPSNDDKLVLKSIPVLKPTAPVQGKLSWRQRTLKKVSMNTESSSRMFLHDIELRGDSPSGSSYAPTFSAGPSCGKFQPKPPPVTGYLSDHLTQDNQSQPKPPGISPGIGIRRQRVNQVEKMEK